MKKILIAAANPLNKFYLRHIEIEKDNIMGILAEYPQYVNPISIDGNIRDIFKNILKKDSESFIFFHYCGHSSMEEIVMEQGGDGIKKIPILEFAKLLKKLSKVEYAFLNSCSSENLGKELLDNSTLKAVIYTTHAVNDKYAAVFAHLFYSSLDKGLSFKEAFEIAETLFRASDYDLSSFQNRDLDDDLSEELPSFRWKMDIKEGCEKEVNEWRIKPPSFLNKLKEETNKKVLCFFEDEGNNRDFFNLIENHFARAKEEKGVSIYSFNEIPKRERKSDLINNFDTLLFFISKNFDKCWNVHKNLIQPDLSKKRIGVLGFKIGFEKSICNLIGSEIPQSRVGLIPNEKMKDFTLDNLCKMFTLEIAFEKYYILGIENIIFQKNLEDKLKENIVDLNFIKQINWIDRKLASGLGRKAVKLPKCNIVHIIGSPKCGQLILIRRLLKLDKDVSQNVERKYRKTGDYSFIKRMDKETLWKFVATSLVKEEKELDAMKMSKAQICIRLETLLESQDHILILDDCDKLKTDQSLDFILKDFWDDFRKEIKKNTHEIKSKFLFFIISRNHCHTTQEEVESKIFHKDDDFFGKTLKPISQIELNILQNWHDDFCESIGSDNSNYKFDLEKIVELKFMEEVATEICKKVGVSDTSFLTNIEI